MSVLPRKSPFKASLISGGGVMDTYAPLFDGLAQYIQLDSPIIIPEGVDFEISVVASGILLDGYRSIFSGHTSENFYRLLPEGKGMQTAADNYVVTWVTSGFDPQNKYLYSLVRNGSNLSIMIDGEVKETRNSSVGSAVIDRLFRSWSTSAYTSGLLYSIVVSIGGVITNSILFNQKDSEIQVASVGSVNATIVNHTPAMWVKV